MLFFTINWIIFYFVFAFSFLFFFGEAAGMKGTWLMTLIGNFFILFSVNKVIFYLSQCPGNMVFQTEFGHWIMFSTFSAEFSMSIDMQTAIMLQLVTGVSFVTQVYSYYYMENEPMKIKFQSYLNLFTFFMVIMVISDNLILFFMGWEGVGLCSYLLIGFWGDSHSAGVAALKAVAINRVGDVAFMCATGLIISFLGITDFANINMMIPLMKQKMIYGMPFQTNFSMIELISFCFALAAMVKSAQFGFHGWLADAMEGPTPVSALIHAATMVTAGIYLLIKMSLVLAMAPMTMTLIAFFGGITAFFGSSVAFYQWDIKKIIAYSTSSQLGYMFCSFGCGFSTPAFFHLITHGYFKALLFFTAGIIIHNANGEQDMSKLGNLAQHLPVSKSFFYVGLTSLMGLPGTSGFFSKENLLDSVVSATKSSMLMNYCLFMMLLALIFTVLYSMKLIYYVFYSSFNGNKHVLKSISSQKQETFFSTIISLIPLVIAAMFIQDILGVFFMDMNGFSLGPSAAVFANKSSLFGETIASQSRYLPAFTMFVSFIFFFNLNSKTKFTFNKKKLSPKLQNFMNFWISFFQKAWLVDIIMINFFFFFFKRFIRTFSIIEKIFGELFLPVTMEYMLSLWSRKIISFTLHYSLSTFFISFTLTTFSMFFFI